jgi:hypothetical protein
MMKIYFTNNRYESGAIKVYVLKQSEYDSNAKDVDVVNSKNQAQIVGFVVDSKYQADMIVRIKK